MSTVGYISTDDFIKKIMEYIPSYSYPIELYDSDNGEYFFKEKTYLYVINFRIFKNAFHKQYKMWKNRELFYSDVFTIEDWFDIDIISKSRMTDLIQIACFGKLKF